MLKVSSNKKKTSEVSRRKIPNPGVVIDRRSLNISKELGPVEGQFYGTSREGAAVPLPVPLALSEKKTCQEARSIKIHDPPWGFDGKTYVLK